MRKRRYAGVLAVFVLVAGVVSAPLRAAAPAAADDGARVVAEQRISAQQIDLTISTPSLPVQPKVRLLVPKDWSPGGGRTYPVLYLLHGCCDAAGYQAWTQYTNLADQVKDAGFIIAMPEGGQAALYSDYATGSPRWETFHVTELPQILERGYAAGTARAVAGLSTGGLGALNYAWRHRGMYRYAASYSGIVCTRLPSVPQLIQAIQLRTGEVVNSVWGSSRTDAATWRAHDPCGHISELRGIGLYLSCGTGIPVADRNNLGGAALEAWASPVNRVFAAELKLAGIPYTSHFYDSGEHTWPYWQDELRRSLPMIAAALGATSR